MQFAVPVDAVLDSELWENKADNDHWILTRTVAVEEMTQMSQFSSVLTHFKTIPFTYVSDHKLAARFKPVCI